MDFQALTEDKALTQRIGGIEKQLAATRYVGSTGYLGDDGRVAAETGTRR